LSVRDGVEIEVSGHSFLYSLIKTTHMRGAQRRNNRAVATVGQSGAELLAVARSGAQQEVTSPGPGSQTVRLTSSFTSPEILCRAAAPTTSDESGAVLIRH
jgi:hypothetical protein